MLRPIDLYFLNKEEPVKSCLQFLRGFILASNKDISEGLSYGMPFFYYKEKRCCYLWVHKKFRQPYIGFVEGNQMDHPGLLKENRSRMKIFLLDAEKDLPVKEINLLLRMAISAAKT